MVRSSPGSTSCGAGGSSSPRWKQVRSPVWQAGPAGSTSEQRVAVAVVADRAHRLRVAGRRALAPQLVARAAPQVQLAGAARGGQRLGVHVREREHLAGAPVLDHAGHEALLVVGDRRVVHRTADRSIRAMRAAILREHGAVPQVGELDDPAGAEVLDVLAAGLNPVDVRIASGAFPNERHEPPYVAGKEGVGRRADGSLVYFDASVEPYGAFGERTEIPAGGGYPVPDGLDPALAVCLGVSGLAAWLPLEWRGGLEPGQSVLILGASGVVGQIGVQAAKLLGAGRVVAAARSEDGLERARALGADATVQLGQAQQDQLAAELREAA